jgi:hypothetical protein
MYHHKFDGSDAFLDPYGQSSSEKEYTILLVSAQKQAVSIATRQYTLTMMFVWKHLCIDGHPSYNYSCEEKRIWRPQNNAGRAIVSYARRAANYHRNLLGPKVLNFGSTWCIFWHS